MTARQVKEGKQVSIADPVQIAVRFYSRDRGGIIGAGGIILPRWLLDTPATIVRRGEAGRRALVGWPTASVDGELVAGGDAGMWLDCEALESR